MVLIGLLLACADSPPAAAGAVVPAAVATLLQTVDARPATAWPEAADVALASALSGLGQQAQPVDVGPLVPLRDVDRRFEQLPGPGPAWLVVATARSEREVLGRFRWTVHVDAIRRDSAVTSTSFEVPVHLERFSDDAEDALLAAMPTLERRLLRWVRSSSSSELQPDPP